MKWFKHFTLASSSEPLRSLIDKHSYTGIGVFWSIMEIVCLSDSMFTVDTIVKMLASKHLSKKKVEDIICNYGIFEVDDRNRVSVSEAFIEAADSAVSAENGITAGENARVDPEEIESNVRARIDKKREDKEVEVEEEKKNDAADDIKNLDDGHWHKKGDWLAKLAQEVGIYRETLCMKAVGWSSMLNKWWRNAVEMYREHITLQGKEDDVCGYDEVKSHFFYYITNGTTSPLVRQYLKDLERESKADEPEDFMKTYFGPELPEDAPPRPSHTAIFDFGDNKWIEPR